MWPGDLHLSVAVPLPSGTRCMQSISSRSSKKKPRLCVQGGNCCPLHSEGRPRMNLHQCHAGFPPRALEGLCNHYADAMKRQINQLHLVKCAVFHPGYSSYIPARRDGTCSCRPSIHSLCNLQAATMLAPSGHNLPLSASRSISHFMQPPPVRTTGGLKWCTVWRDKLQEGRPSPSNHVRYFEDEHDWLASTGCLKRSPAHRRATMPGALDACTPSLATS
jgi:hypothetical protein